MLVLALPDKAQFLDTFPAVLQWSLQLQSVIALGRGSWHCLIMNANLLGLFLGSLPKQENSALHPPIHPASVELTGSQDVLWLH